MSKWWYSPKKKERRGKRLRERAKNGAYMYHGKSPQELSDYWHMVCKIAKKSHKKKQAQYNALIYSWLLDDEQENYNGLEVFFDEKSE